MMSEDLTELKARLAVLENTVREMKALSKGDPGRDGKDGRDGRDGKSIDTRQVMSVMRDAARRGDRIFIHPPTVTVMPAEVRSPDIHVAAPTVNFSPEVKVDTHQHKRTVTRHTRDANGELVESIAEHE